MARRKLSCLILNLPKKQNLDTSKLEEFANGSFRLDQNDSESSKRVENTVEKG